MMCRVALIILAALLAAPVQCAFWDVEPVYLDGLAAGDASLVIDGGDVPYISYAADSQLYLAHRTTEAWISNSIAPVGFVGGWSSVAFDSTSQPRIAYIDTTGASGSDLKYAYRSLGVWHYLTVDTLGGALDYVSLAVASNNGPAWVAYCKATGSYPNQQYHIYCARIYPTGVVNITLIADIGGLTAPAIAIGYAGSMYIAFCDPGTGQMKLATQPPGSSWQTGIIEGDLTKAAIPYPAIAIQSDGYPALAYVLKSAASAELRFARRVGSGWLKQTAASLAVSQQYHCSVCVGAGGIPFICYWDPASDTFKNTWLQNGAWFSETIDLATGTGLRPTMKRDSLGNIHAAYFDRDNSNVKFAWAKEPITEQEAKASQDGVIAQVSGLIASTAAGELENRIYAQTADRVSGIALYYPSGMPGVSRGDVLDVQGTLTTVDGEKAMNEPYIALLGSTTAPQPLAIGSQSMGGGSFGFLAGPPPSGQQGITGASGLNNVGLLVRSWGSVTYVDTHTFQISDGSGTVICRTPSAVTVDPTWTCATVTGVSSCELSGTDLVRVIRVRSSDDITTIP